MWGFLDAAAFARRFSYSYDRLDVGGIIEAFKKPPNRHPECGMYNIGRQFVQRHEDEPSCVEAGMWNRKAGVRYHHLPKEQNIEINDS